MAGTDEAGAPGRYTQAPPATFNPDYARFLLAQDQLSQDRARAGKAPLERFGLLIALVAGLAGAATSLLNAAFYWNDRAGRAQQETFNNQLSVSKLYFDKMTGEGFCKNKDDALLYARTSLLVARLDEPPLRAEIEAERLAPPGADRPRREGIEGLAALLYRDVVLRTKDQCDGGDVQFTARPGGVAEAVPTSRDATSYALAQPAGARAAPTLPASGTYTVYIQYDAASAEARQRATGLQESMREDPTLRAPGIEGVSRVPGQDQIRIYRREDEAKAREVQARPGLAGAQIVNLGSAYPNLPARTMEVWLGKR